MAQHTHISSSGESLAALPARSAGFDRFFSLEDKHPITLFHLFWIFVICSVVGLVVETLVSYPLDGVWKNRAGLVWGPFSPIYGVGGIIMTLALWYLSDRPLWESFVVAALLGGTFELVVGFLLKHLFGIIAWSYIDQPFNIGGYTCLGISIIWGVAGVIWVKVGLPITLSLIDLIPLRIRKPLTIAMATFLIVDIVVTLASFSFWFNRQAGLPITSSVAQFFAQYFGDDFMSQRFQTMSMWTSLADR